MLGGVQSFRHRDSTVHPDQVLVEVVLDVDLADW
jgi:hypothetical protein